MERIQGTAPVVQDTSPLCIRGANKMGVFGPALLIAEVSITEEPGAVIPHAGICAGAVG